MISSMKMEMSGFILKGIAFDQNDQCVLKFFAKSKDQNFQIIIDNYENYFYVESDKASSLKTIDGKFVEKINVKSLKQKKIFKENLDSAQKRTYEFDIRPVERFLMDNRLYGAVKIIGEAKNINGNLVFRNPQISPGESYPDFKIYSFDIETGKNGQVLSIAYHCFSNNFEEGKAYIVSKQKVEVENLVVASFETELEMLKTFMNEIIQIDPDLIIGWNVIGFDLKYLYERCEKLNLKFNISRDQFETRMFQNPRGDWSIDIPGRVVIDGPWALKTNFFSFESFKLNEVAKNLLGETKDIDEDEVFDKWGEIERRYREDQAALIKYNFKDSLLVSQIFNKTKLIDLFINRSFISGMLMERIGGSTAAFDHFFLPDFHLHGFVAPNVIDVEWDKEAKGGFVLNPKVGIHENVLVLDFKSLYPTLIRTFYIDPLSRLKSDVETVITPMGFKFSKTENILPKKIEYLLEQRSKAKKEKNDNLSMAIKILMNSFYGVMGSSGCRFYHSDLPDAITGTGQWFLKTTIEFLESLGLEILYGDTDSIFVKLEKLDNLFINGREIVTKVNHFLTNKLKNEYQVDSFMEIQFDKAFKKLILTSTRSQDEGAKKRYAGLVIKENNLDGEIVMTGMEFVRSDWSKLAKNFQYEIVKKVFSGISVKEFILETIKDLESGKLNDQLVLKKRLTKPLEEYVKNIPPHVKALKMLKEKTGIVKNRAEYVMTLRGPFPVELQPKDIDYNYYIEKQLAPVANSILNLIGEDFNQLRNDQLSLF